MQIRPCRPEELPQVVQLFLKSFPSAWHSSADELADYFAQVYFDNPWANDDFPSLVCDQSGSIDGFVGVTPRRMKYHGERIEVVVPSAFMTSQEAGRRNPIIAVSLMRRLLDGKQDLTITDTANELSRSLWTNCGGTVAFPYTFNWLRPLRPLGAGTKMASRILPRFASALANPLAQFGDAITSSLSINPFKAKTQSDLIVVDMHTSAHLEAMQSLPAHPLVPSYDLSTLQWLIDMAQKSEKNEGALARRMVRDQDGGLKGWFVYYQNRRSVGRVLQLVATRQSMQEVFNCLLRDAQEAGVAALWGRTDPVHPDLATQKLCVFLAKPLVLAHSKRPEIIQSVLAGEMFFSGLDGELWMTVNAWQ